MSIRMKKAHLEGKAFSWRDLGHEDSYPEKFFIEVIKNQFYDKNYEKDYRVGKYYLDFAWVAKKKYIEIDGEQHDREPQKSKDIIRDNFLIANGWKVLRIKWKDIFRNPQLYIRIAIDFIDK